NPETQGDSRAWQNRLDAYLKILKQRGVIASRTPCNFRFRPVSEPVGRPRSDDAALLQDFEIGVPGDFAKRENRLGFQDFEFAFEITPAIRDFPGERLVVRRGAAAGGGDVGPIEFEAVVAVAGDRLIRETGLVQRGVQEVARAVAGEHASGTIGSMRGRRQAEDQQLCLPVAESGHGLAPVFAIAISAALLARDLLPVLHEARALPARDNLLVQHAKRRGRLRHWLHLRGASSYGSIRSGEWIRQTSSRKNVIRTSPFRF